MSFNSGIFLLCLPIVILLYWLLPHKFRWIMLLAVSYAFYMSWNAWLIFLIMFTTVVSYVSGIVMDKSKNKKLKTACLVITLICCLGVLFFFKYFTFVVNLVIDMLNWGSLSIPEFTFNLILPVGISFYTFQTLSYVIDVYKGKINAERHFGYYALYVVYFPQLVAGPIERPENLLPQLKNSRRFCSDDLFKGLVTALGGYFKKIVIADGAAKFVNAVYNNVQSATGLTAALATLLFAVQIYCDFSGYSDIAVGIARMMGIKLCDNFDRPYSATSIKDFWRRWHISLTGWFTDYVYIPLGGNRCKLWRWTLNVMIVFLLSGLWHGAALTFIVWGGIHGAYRVIGRLKDIGLSKLERNGKIKIMRDNTAVTVVRRTITFALVCFAWIFFRANSLGDSGVIVSKIFSDWSGSIAALKAIEFDWLALLNTALAAAALAVLPRIVAPSEALPLSSSVISRYPVYVYMVTAVAVAWIALIAGGGESSFIYFQF